MNPRAWSILGNDLCNLIIDAEKQNIGSDFIRYHLYIHIVENNEKKYYVGITQRNPYKRWGRNGCGYGNIHFSNAISKYGWSNIEHIIISKSLTKNQAFLFEQEAIKELKSNDRKHGYNISSGGDGGNRKETYKVKQYDIDGNFIQTYKSAAEAGRCVGVDRTNITHACRKRKLAAGFQWCYENEDINSPYVRADQRAVCQIDPSSGDIVKVFHTLDYAHRMTSISKDNIQHAIKGHWRRTAGGFIWKYA